MNQGILQSSPVQQMVAAASNNWFSNNASSSLLAAPPPNHIPHHLTPPPTAPLSWPPASQELQHSWSQLVLGFAGEDDKAEISHMQNKNMENWEQQLLNNSPITSAGGAKQESTAASYAYSTGNLEFAAAKSTNCLSPPMVSASPPKCSSMRNDVVLGFSDKSSESFMKCNNSSSKKAKMNPATPAQSGMKVRKEKLGDRITALHQLVSPFGKTDTASVLLEAIGYIRFLQRQIEALSLPYLGTGSPNTTHQQPVKRERSCLFPEDPGQLLNENHRKRKAISNEECNEEAKKDLKSRGLCLVPLSCTVDFGSENNGADYWAPAAFGGNFQ